MGEPVVEVRRSKRRRRTVTAYREEGRVVVCLPASFSHAEERQWIRTMLDRLEAQEARRRPSDEILAKRADQLSRRYLEGRAKPTSVQWSANQNAQWGSCTPADSTIRLSDRLQGVPSWVLDYVLVHELAHLLIAGHNDEFWTLVDRYPKSQRARGFLEGLTHAAGLPPDDEVI